MATIAEIRAQYPQYSDMPDAALADALHKKFYSDIPRPDFDAKIGLTAAPAAPVAAAPEMTTGQKIYNAVRPYAAPTLEALGAAGGAAVGGGAGMLGGGPIGLLTGGTIGAGAGYAGAKSLLKTADVAMGVAPPESLGEAAARTAYDAVEGAAFQAGGNVVGNALGTVAGKVMDMGQLSKNKAAQIVRDSLGPDSQKVLDALKSSKGNISAAQATSSVNSPTWQALIDKATARDPRFLNALKTTQGEESLNALAKLMGGTTATEARAVTGNMKNALNTTTTPMREASLGRANLGKFVADETAIREANDLAVLIGTGGEINPAQFAAQATGAEKALRSVGVKPLEGAPLADKIMGISQNSAFAENDLIKGATTQVAEGIRRWTASNGVIDANALEAIRKNAVDAAIAKLRPGTDATAQRNAAASVMSKIKPLIDDAIEAAGGAGWRDYLKAYSQGMTKINEKKLVGAAADLWKNDKDGFVKLVQGNSPEAVEKIMGAGNYNIAKTLADDTMGVLESEASKIIRDANIKSQVAGGQDALKQLLLQNVSKFRLPSYLSAVAATTNKALSILENKIGTKTMATMTEALKTPQGAAELIETLPAKERVRVLKLLADPTQWGKGVGGAVTGATAGAVNALAPERNSSNALAPEAPRLMEAAN